MGKGLKRLAMLAVMVVMMLGIFPQMKAQAGNIVIVLDPGHGGTEAGAQRTWSFGTYKEELLNLKIANYCKAELETYNGVTVYMTRTTNTGAAMDRLARIKYAKSKNATALVSLHINSTAAQNQKTMSGCFSCVPSKSKYPDSNQYAKISRALASSIRTQLNAQVGLKNNGEWIDDELGIILYGMKYKVPSMIIEHCFINNPNDCRNYLTTEAQLKKLGVADAAGIAKYYNLTKKGSSPALNGWVTKGSKKYYYTNGVMARSVWKKIGSSYYYFEASGALKTGVYKLSSGIYVTNKSGARQKGLVKVGNYWYYADSKGKIVTGWKTVKGKKYYFSKTTGRAYTGLKTIGKQKYYFSYTTAAMLKQWVTGLSGKRYYFSKIDGRMMKNYWVKTSGKWYYVGKDGVMLKNTKKSIAGKTYKFNSKGVCTNKK